METDLRAMAHINEEIKAVIAMSFMINLTALNAIVMSKRNNTQSGFSVVSNEVRVFSGELNQIMERLRIDVAHVMRHAASLQKMQKLQQLMQQAAVEMQKRGLKIDPQAVGRGAEALNQVWTVFSRETRKLETAVDDALKNCEMGVFLSVQAKIEAAYSRQAAAAFMEVADQFAEKVGVVIDYLHKIRQLARDSRNEKAANHL
ncbi:MAG: hypothetical protein EKK59_07140 [Neisseriaceae bacterium]|nr:MAG: hypothetical protein EKK59_07140 [Neisseriaceae bacterium]